MPRIFIVILFIFYANLLIAQRQEVHPAIVYKGDTIPQILLKEVTVKSKTHRPAYYRRYVNRYSRLEFNVRKVYPYARIAASKIQEIDRKLHGITNKSERKQIIKEEYTELMKNFKAPLMKLSISQGRILVKLIYRETNATSFNHIREYRGGFNAYFWQSLALLFGNNLKAGYAPYGEDAEIEEIVQKIKNNR